MEKRWENAENLEENRKMSAFVRTPALDLGHWMAIGMCVALSQTLLLSNILAIVMGPRG